MGINKQYKLYIFDLDGTLVDTKLDIARALQKVLKEKGLDEPSLDEVITAIGGGAKNAMHKLTGLEGDALQPYVEDFMTAYETMCSDNTVVYEGGEELLRRLKASGAKLAVVTMKSKVPTLKILQAHQLDMFDDVLSFDDVEKRKPDPESLHKLQIKFGVNPDETLVIGDTSVDIQYAQNANVDVCAVEYGYGDTQELLDLKPQYVIKSFLDF